MESIISKTKDILVSNKFKSTLSNLLEDIKSVLALASYADEMLPGHCFFNDSVEVFDSYVKTIIIDVERAFEKNSSDSCPASDQSE